MGLVCQLVFQPVIKLIHVVVAVVEFILVQICRLIQEFVSVVSQVLKVGGLCVNCINVAALNVLILSHVWG